jgi:hypothetical protein
MHSKCLKISIAITALVALTMFYWYVIEPVHVSFFVQPGGNDVVVEIDGSAVQPSSITNNGNVYVFHIGLHRGRHRMRIAKPGYVTQFNEFTIDWDQGECYPNIPPLSPNK